MRVGAGYLMAGCELWQPRTTTHKQSITSKNNPVLPEQSRGSHLGSWIMNQSQPLRSCSFPSAEPGSSHPPAGPSLQSTQPEVKFAWDSTEKEKPFSSFLVLGHPQIHRRVIRYEDAMGNVAEPNYFLLLTIYFLANSHLKIQCFKSWGSSTKGPKFGFRAPKGKAGHGGTCLQFRCSGRRDRRVPGAPWPHGLISWMRALSSVRPCLKTEGGKRLRKTPDLCPPYPCVHARTKHIPQAHTRSLQSTKKYVTNKYLLESIKFISQSSDTTLNLPKTFNLLSK